MTIIGRYFLFMCLTISSVMGHANDTSPVPLDWDNSDVNFVNVIGALDTIPPPWDKITLTGAHIKYPVAVVPATPFPWLPVAGGVAGAGVLTYVIIQASSNNDDPPTDLVVRDDQATVECNGQAIVDVLTNDSGDGLQIISVSPVQGVEITFSGGVVTITLQSISQSFATTASIQDQYGQSATSTLTVDVTVPIVDAADDNYEVEYGSVLSENILTNDVGSNLSVTNYDQPDGGTVTITSTGAMTFTAADDFQGQTSFTYTVSGPCEQESQATVNINVLAPDCTFSASITTEGSECGHDNGTASVNVEPAANYTYTWSNGETSADVQNLAPGEYTVTIFSEDGECSETLDVTIDELPPDWEATFETTDAGCGASNGSVNVTINPTDEYTYAWSNGATTATVSDLPAGIYSVTVTRSGTNCTLEFQATIGELPADFEATFETTDADCGASNGSVIVTINPTDDYTYIWSNGATTESVSDLPAGEYSITVTKEGTDCILEFQVIIGENQPAFDASFETTNSSCGESDGSATITVTPDGDYTYAWSTGATTITASDLSAGVYTVTVTLAGTDCSKSFEVTLEDEGVDYQATFQSTPATCGLSNGTVSVAITPDGVYTFEWSNGATGDEITELATGQYTVTVTGDANCSQIFTTEVGEDPADYIVSISTVPGNCLGEGGDIILSTQTDGEGPMLISITGAVSIEIEANAGETNLKDYFTVIPGDYQISVSDKQIGTSCEESGAAQVTDNTEFSAFDDDYVTTDTEPLNANVLDNDTGIQLQVTDFTQPSSGSVTLSPDGSFTYTPETDATGTFTFEYTVIDACGNTDTRVVTIVVNTTTCNFTISVVADSAHCGLSDGAIDLDVQPPGTYTYVWSNGNTTEDLVNIESGSYTVTVSSTDLNCSQDSTVIVNETLPAYIVDIVSAPGNCIGGGDITVELMTHGSGPLELFLTGPNLDEYFVLDPGIHQLGALIDLPSGEYSITVFDAGAGDTCAEQSDVTIDDDTPDLNATDDFYDTPFETAFSHNVLNNDEGFDIELTDISNQVGGTVSFGTDGSFTFTPDNGFSGQASFDYTVTDACGNEQTATAFIEVAVSVCSFTTSFETVNANCGAEDGMITATVDIPGNYTYFWSTGETGETITAGAGTYNITITDVDLGCSLEFEAILNQSDTYPFFDNTIITDETCQAPGNITFNLSSATGASVDINVSGPTVGMFTVDPGLVVLGDLMTILPGDYVISATDTETGCENEFDAAIAAAVLPAIAVESTVPPSSESANDGSITVVFTTETVDPYTYYLNGLPIGAVLPPVFTIPDLSAGTYMIQIEDGAGCFSNELDVDLFPGGGFSLIAGIGVSSGFADPTFSTVEHPTTNGNNPKVIHQSLYAAHRIQHHGLVHETRADVSIHSGAGVLGSQGLLRVQHTLGKQLSFGDWDILLDGGVVLALPVGDIAHRSRVTSWTVRVGAEKRILNNFIVRIQADTDGWDTFYYPRLTLSLGRIIF